LVRGSGLWGTAEDCEPRRVRSGLLRCGSSGRPVLHRPSRCSLEILARGLRRAAVRSRGGSIPEPIRRGTRNRSIARSMRWNHAGRHPARRAISCTSISALLRSPSCSSNCIGYMYRYVSALTDSANESDILYSVIQNAIRRHDRLRSDGEIVFLLTCSIDIPRRVTIREHGNGRR
jgi:hypothetical protein